MMLRKLSRQKLKGLRPLSRRRRNPDTPFGVMPAKWKEALERGKQEARAMLLGVRAELVSSGIPTEALPEPFELNKRSEEIGTIIASSEYADLAAQSKLDTPSKKVAEQVFSVFEKVEAEKSAKPVLAKATRVFASRLDTLRAPALAKRKATGAQVRQASEDAVEEELRRKLAERDALRERAGIVSEEEVEDDDDDADDDDDIDSRYEQAKKALKRLQRSSPARAPLVAFVKAYESGDPDAIMQTVTVIREMEDAARAAETEEVTEVVEERVERRPRGRRAPAEKPSQARRTTARRAPVEEVVEEEEEVEDDSDLRFSGTVSRAGERLASYEGKRARVRRRVPLSEALRAETAGDILLYVLNDRTTQVRIKGSLTESFVTPSQGKSSWKLGAQYAKNWLEIPGATGAPKKSRLGMRVVVAWEGEPDKFEVVLPARTGAGAPPQGKLPSLAEIGEQAREAVGRTPKRNPYSRQGFLRNPFGRQVVADVREVFRRSNPGWFVTGLAAAGGFVAGTYAEAEFGLSKQFTRGGREVARAAQQRRLPELPKLPEKPKVKTAKDFKPSARLAKMYRDFNAVEAKKKRTPLSQEAERAALEDRLDDMWDAMKALEAQEMAEQGIRSNPGKAVNPDVAMLLWESERAHLTDMLESQEDLVASASRRVAKWQTYGAPKTAEERRNYDRHVKELAAETENLHKIKGRLSAHLSRKPKTNPLRRL